jgi:integrase
LGSSRRATENLTLAYRDILAAKTENTRRVYLLAVQRFLEINGFDREEDAVKSLRRRGADEALLKFVSALRESGLAPKSILLYLSGVRAWLDLHEIKYSPAKLRRFLPKKQPIKDSKPLRKSEVKLIINAMRPSKRLALWTMWACGLRIEEAIDLRVGDVDLSSDPPRLYVRRSKTLAGRRLVFIPGDLAQALAEHVRGKRPDDYLFPSEKGPAYRMSDDRFRIAFYGALRRLGLNRRDPSGRGWIYSPHSLRRGFETALINAGCPAIVVSMLMGHDLGTEASYFKPSERELAETWRKYENALRLDVEEVTPSAIKEEIEGMRQLVATYAKLIVEGMVMQDPESAKTYLRRHPELLRAYLEEHFKRFKGQPWLEAYMRRQGRSVDEALNEKLARILNNDEELEKFITGLIMAKNSP